MARLRGGAAAPGHPGVAAHLYVAATDGAQCAAQGGQRHRAGGTRPDPADHVAELPSRRRQGQRRAGGLHGERVTRAAFLRRGAADADADACLVFLYVRVPACNSVGLSRVSDDGQA